MITCYHLRAAEGKPCQLYTNGAGIATPLAALNDVVRFFISRALLSTDELIAALPSGGLKDQVAPWLAQCSFRPSNRKKRKRRLPMFSVYTKNLNRRSSVPDSVVFSTVIANSDFRYLVVWV